MRSLFEWTPTKMMKDEIKDRLSKLREEAEELREAKEETIRNSPTNRGATAALNRVEDEIEFLQNLL